MRTLAERCRAIELLVMDVDGVLTDGQIIYTDLEMYGSFGRSAGEMKAFHVRDGSAIKRWLQAGKRAAFLTGRSSPIVERRGQELGVTAVLQGTEHKLPGFEKLLADLNVSAEQTAYIGDDWPDVPLLERAGLAAAVADASTEAKAAAHYVTRTPGGRGAVRELIEVLLRHQGVAL